MSKIAWARLVFFIGLIDVVVAAVAWKFNYCDIATIDLAFAIGLLGVVLGSLLLDEAIERHINRKLVDD